MRQISEHVVEKNISDISEPSRYRVLLLNDDYTTMDFVIMILMLIFHKSLEDAQAIMLQVHRGGKASCGVYTFETAETKAAQVTSMAHDHKFPLRCAIEEE